MTDTRHTKRDSLEGFNRKRLRGTLRVAMGVKSNADMFEGRGQSWHTTEAQQRKEAQERALLEKHLREASLNETRFINHLFARLRDPGPVEPVVVNKNKLAQENKQRREQHASRRINQNKNLALARRVNRLATLHKELQANERVAAVTTDKRKEYGHFIMEKD